MLFNPFYSDPLFEQKREERKKIRFAGNVAGFAFLMLTSIMLYWSYPVRSFIDAFFRNPREVYEILGDPAVIQVIQITVSTLAFTVPFFIYLKIMGTNISKVGGYNKPKKKLLVPFVLTGLGVCGLANCLASLMGNAFQTVFELFDYTYAFGSNPLPQGPFGMALSFLATAVTPALVEEFALRGAVMGALRKYGDGFAIVTSALLFGLMHGNLVQIPFAFVLGLFFGYAVIKTGSIWTAVIIHFLNNLFSLVYSYFYAFAGGEVFVHWFFSIFYIMILLLAGFVGYAMMSARRQNDFELNNKEGLLSTGKKLLVFLTAPVMIISYVAVIAETFWIRAV